VLLIYLPNIVSAQWETGGNSGLPEGVKNFLGTHDNVSVRFITNNIERMRLAPNGNFGIGTNNPQKLLHVNGAIRFQNLSSGTQTTALMIDANGDLSKRTLHTVAFSGSYNDLTNLPSLNVANWNTAFSWGNHAAVGYLTSYTETDPVFIASPSFGISSANITNWDAAYSWGNHATAGYLTSYAETDPIFTAAFEITNPQTGQLLQYNGSKWQNFSHNFISEYQDLIVSDNSLELTNSTSSISLDGINYWSRLNSNLYYNSGSVGIGINGPNKLLHLHSESTYFPGGETGPVVGDLNLMSPKGRTSVSLNSESTLLLTNKNSGSEATDGLLIRSYNNNATISLQEEGSLSLITKKPLRFKMQQNGNISIGTFNTNYFTVNENGNVGVGTDEPEQALHIKGNKMLVEQNGNKLYLDADNGGVEIGSSTNQVTFWYAGNYNKIIAGDVISNGRIGIGTNAPQYLLDVRGTAHFFEVRVNTDSWPDFVFADNYKLPDLVELEKFIKTNRHLPGVPSEAEVIENGVDLGEMNKVLLQKVEELTLIIIEQDKRLRELEEDKQNNRGN